MDVNKTSRIAELAAIISDKTDIVDEYFKSHQLPPLSFAPDAPAKVQIPPHETDVIAAQDAVIASTQELHDLMKGPTEMLLGLSVSAAVRVRSNDANRYGSRSLIPTML